MCLVLSFCVFLCLVELLSLLWLCELFCLHSAQLALMTFLVPWYLTDSRRLLSFQTYDINWSQTSFHVPLCHDSRHSLVAASWFNGINCLLVLLVSKCQMDRKNGTNVFLLNVLSFKYSYTQTQKHQGQHKSK